MNFKELKADLRADVYRNHGFYSAALVLKEFFNPSPTSFLIKLRVTKYLSTHKKNPLLFLAYCWFRYLYRRIQVKVGIEMKYTVNVGRGLRIPHRGAIVIHENAVIGTNCEILQCVTIGNNPKKSPDKVAVIGNGVTLGAGAKIIGPVRIGNYSCIGANAVVVKDVPDCAVAAGVPAKILARDVKNEVLFEDYDTVI